MARGISMKNLKWKKWLWENNKTNRWISQKTGIPENYLSMAINGRLNLNETEKQLVASCLKMRVEELFGGMAQGRG